MVPSPQDLMEIYSELNAVVTPNTACTLKPVDQ